MIRRPPRSPLFPSPPLFRSARARRRLEYPREELARRDPALALRAARPKAGLEGQHHRRQLGGRVGVREAPAHGAAVPRSEEHTSELQSPCNLVCRLLLEKKKITMCAPPP